MTPITQEPGNLESQGSVCIVVPTMALLTQKVDRETRFLWCEALSHSATIDVPRLLRAHRLHEFEAGPAEHFNELKPRIATAIRSQKDVGRLFGLLCELQEGDPNRGREAYSRQAAVWANAYRSRVTDAVYEAIETGGPRPGRQVLQSARETVEGWKRECEKRVHQAHGPADRTELAALSESMPSLRRDAGPVAALIRRVNPNASLRLVKNAPQRTQLSKAAKTIEAEAHRQHKLRADEAIIPGLEALCEEGGFFDEVEQTIAELEAMADAFPIDRAPRLRSAGPEELLLVESIDDACGNHGETFGDLLDRCIAASGHTRATLVKQLWREGLPLGGRRLKPPQWRTASPSDVYQALRRYIIEQFGLQDLDRPVRIDRPETAADHFASLHLLHPDLRQRLQAVIAEWVRLAKPHLVVADGQPTRQNVYLHCYPSHRAEWLELLSCHVRPTPAPHGDGDLSHPMRAVLTITRIGVNGHHLPQLREGLHQAAQRESAGEPVLRHEHAAGELRLIASRPENPEEYPQLLRACLAGGVVRPLGEGLDQLMLTRSEPSVQRHFFATNIEPVEQSARYYQELLRDDRFVRFVEVHRPGTEDWPATARRLGECPSPDDAAKRLVTLGVLEPAESGGYLLAGPPPSSLRHAPRGLYRQSLGEAVGLTKQQFIAALRDDKRLLSVVAFHALDAWIDGRLTGEDLPPFVRELREELESD